MSDSAVLVIKRYSSGKRKSFLKLRNKKKRKAFMVGRIGISKLIKSTYKLPLNINGPESKVDEQAYVADNVLTPLSSNERKKIYYMMNTPRDQVENKLKEFYMETDNLEYEFEDKKSLFYMKIFQRLCRNKVEKNLKDVIKSATPLTDLPLKLVTEFLGVGKKRKSL